MTKKISKKINKSKINKTKSATRSRRLSKSKVMKGGNAGRYVLPAAYFSDRKEGYYPNGSPELSTTGKNHSVSQGVTWEGGKYAGPNLYPSMTGGGCGFNDKRNKNQNRKSTSKKSKCIKSKSRKSKSSKA